MLSSLAWEDVDASLRSSVPIDDVWDDSQRMPKSREFRFLRGPSESIVLVMDRDRRYPPVRATVRDPRVGCLLFKMCQRQRGTPMERMRAALADWPVDEASAGAPSAPNKRRRGRGGLVRGDGRSGRRQSSAADAPPSSATAEEDWSTFVPTTLAWRRGLDFLREVVLAGGDVRVVGEEGGGEDDVPPIGLQSLRSQFHSF